MEEEELMPLTVILASWLSLSLPSLGVSLASSTILSSSSALLLLFSADLFFHQLYSTHNVWCVGIHIFRGYIYTTKSSILVDVMIHIL